MDVRQVYALQREAEQAEQRYSNELAIIDQQLRQSMAQGHIVTSQAWDAPSVRALRAEADEAQERAREAQAKIGGKVFRVANLGALEQKIKRFQKKAEKLGSGAITFVKTDEKDVEYHPVDEEQRFIGFDAANPLSSLCAIYSITYYFVIVSGEAPKLPGWTFLATVEHTDAGNIIRDVPVWNQEQLVSEHVHEYDAREYRFVAPDCAHCGLPRDRKDTFLVREDATGEIKQVGRNCLADFTGINDPMRAAKAAEWYRDFFTDGDDEDEERIHSYAREEYGFGTDEFLAQAAAVIRKDDGYRKADWDRPTAETAWYSLRNYGKVERGVPQYVEIEDEDVLMATRVREWAKDIPADTTNDYLFNVRTAVLSDLITWRRKGIAASAIAAFQRDETKRVERELREKEAAEKPEAGHYGEEGKRSRGVELTVTFRKYFEPTYDNPYSKTLLKFETPEGHKITWWASNTPLVTVRTEPVTWDGQTIDRPIERGLVVGDKIVADFTVKRHQHSDKWGAETTINRLTVKDTPGLVEVDSVLAAERQGD